MSGLVSNSISTLNYAQNSPFNHFARLDFDRGRCQTDLVKIMFTNTLTSEAKKFLRWDCGGALSFPAGVLEGGAPFENL